MHKGGIESGYASEGRRTTSENQGWCRPKDEENAAKATPPRHDKQLDRLNRPATLDGQPETEQQSDEKVERTTGGRGQTRC